MTIAEQIKQQKRENIYIKYLIKKGIVKKGLRSFEENEKEISEFKRLLNKLEGLNPPEVKHDEK